MTNSLDKINDVIIRVDKTASQTADYTIEINNCISEVNNVLDESTQVMEQQSDISVELLTSVKRFQLEHS